jgi:hypothetical protein
VIAGRVNFELELELVDIYILWFEAFDDRLLSSSVKIEIESEDSLLRVFLNFGSVYRFLVRHIQLGFLSWEGISLLADHFKIPSESVWECISGVIGRPPPGQFDSLIISSFPDILAEFGGKRFLLLWRGGRDGFGASDFHFRCDGHANTLTVILDTNGNIFGGFTPLAWESPPQSKYKADDSLKSFVFTLKNPHNITARRFGLKPAWKHCAIYCGSEWGPRFPGGILIQNNCDGRADSSASRFG